jgi:phytoene dehydrogenase-like protein
MIHHDEFMRIVGSGGEVFILYCDPDRLESHMKEISPDDRRLIEAFTDSVRQFMHFDMSLLQVKHRALMGPVDWLRLGLKMSPFTGALIRWSQVSAQDFANRFKHPFLRQAIRLAFAWPDNPMMACMAQLAYMHVKNGAFPAGGSLEFARAIERRYLELGGEINYKSQVEKILVEDDRAIGVRLYNDQVHRADVVISAADGHLTIFEMLEGKYANHRIRRTYDGHLPVLSQLQVSLGVDRDLSREPHWVTYLLDEPIIIAGDERHEISVKHYCFDPSLAPAGKSVIEVMVPTQYGYWQRIYGHKLYDTEQIQVSEVVIGQLEKIYPGIRQQIEVIDVATPLSYERYTGNWMGSTCGWLLTKQTMRLMFLGLDKTLPGLKNFYLAGQWVEPGGSLPLAAMSGRNTIQLVCHRDRKPFVTTTPPHPPTHASQGL